VASRNGRRTDTNLSEAPKAFEAFLEELHELFAGKRAAAAWLDKPLSVLKERTPREMILDGHVDRVTGVLYALNAGVSL
jgi:uncharacterized protein (DUF2384 family)